MSGLYSMGKKDFDKCLDYTRIKPYGDTMNDGKIQLSFTLPVKDDDRGIQTAKELAIKMGVMEPNVAHHEGLDANFAFYVVYGNVNHTVNYEDVHVESVNVEVMDMKAIDAFIKDRIGKKLVVLGASTGTDAHTVGIDAIMNMKGFAGHYGLERYDMIDAINLGSQVENEEFVKKVIEVQADVLLVSQTVTQKNIHINNLTNLVELLEAEGIRDKVILICGGPRITHELAKELGYDAGFGPGKFAEHVASFFVNDYTLRKERLL